MCCKVVKLRVEGVRWARCLDFIGFQKTISIPLLDSSLKLYATCCMCFFPSLNVYRFGEKGTETSSLLQHKI